MHRLESIA